MRRFLRCTAVAVVLLGGIGVAAAADSVVIEKSPLYLTTAQEQWIYQHLGSEKGQSIPAEFHAGIGVTVPKSLTLYRLPKSLADQVPAVRTYEAVKLADNTLLLVDPRDREVADVIAGAVTTAGDGI
jgi:hypothetical protein